MLFQGSASVRRPIAAAAAVMVLLAGSTFAYAKDGQGNGRGGGGGGGNGGGGKGGARMQQSAPSQGRSMQRSQQPARQAQREVRSSKQAAPAPQKGARAEQRVINQQSRQVQQQARQADRAQQRATNQQNKQAADMARLNEKLAQREVKQEKQAFLQDQRAQKRALEDSRTSQRREERAEVKSLNKLEQQQRRDARDLKRTENRTAEVARRDARRAEDAARRQSRIDQKLADRGNRADNPFAADAQRRGRGRNNIVVNGDGNTVIKKKVVNKYYGWGGGPYCGSRGWYNGCDDGWSFSIGFSSWGCNTFGFSYNWYDDDCWRPCRPTWCGPSWYYRSYCWPRFTTYCAPVHAYYVYPSYVCHPVYSYTSGADYGYYGSVSVNTYATTASASYSAPAYDVSVADPFEQAATVETFDADDGAMDYDWSAPSYTYSDTYEPSSSPTAEMARGNDAYGAMSGDLIGAVKPDRVFDNQPASEQLNANIAWQLLEDARYQDALTRFSAAAQAESGDAAAKVGYALAAAMLGRDDTAAWAMRRAFVLDPETVGFIPESEALRRDLDKLASRLERELGSDRSRGVVNVSDRWFLLASVQYLRRDTAAAKASLDRSIHTDQVRDSTANFQRLLDRAS